MGFKKGDKVVFDNANNVLTKAERYFRSDAVLTVRTVKPSIGRVLLEFEEKKQILFISDAFTLLDEVDEIRDSPINRAIEETVKRATEETVKNEDMIKRDEIIPDPPTIKQIMERVKTYEEEMVATIDKTEHIARIGGWNYADPDDCASFLNVFKKYGE